MRICTPCTVQTLALACDVARRLSTVTGRPKTERRAVSARRRRAVLLVANFSKGVEDLKVFILLFNLRYAENFRADWIVHIEDDAKACVEIAGRRVFVDVGKSVRVAEFARKVTA